METIMQWWNAIDWLIDPAQHFLLAFTAGALVYLLTSTMSFVLLSAWGIGTRKQTSSAVVYGIHICCLLLGVSAALLSHYLLDYGWQLYSTPLYPGLDLVMP